MLVDQGQSDWQAVSVGAAHTCAIKANGNAFCWGDNEFGETSVASGDTLCGTSTFQFRCVLVPQQVQPGLKFQSISAGLHHTCAITLSYDAYCWGANDAGQLSVPLLSGATLVKIAGTLPWAQISAGASHTCAVRSDGQLFCWGSNNRGELGNNSFVSSVTPVRAQVPGQVASVSAGEERSCARTTVGKVYCWGSIWTLRQDGLEIFRATSTPELVPAAPAMASLTVGAFTTCATTIAEVAYCWEANPRGEMGIGSDNGSTLPLTVVTGLRFVKIATGIVQTCGIATDGAGYCWGDDSFGELGVPSSLVIARCSNQLLPCITTPEPITGEQRFIDLSTGFGSHSCGVTTQGNLYCWGLGTSGQRGDGTSRSAVSTPLRVVEPAAQSP